jgi:hypothetical protein
MDQDTDDILDYGDEYYEPEALEEECSEQRRGEAPAATAPEPMPRLNTALGAEEGELDAPHDAARQHVRSRFSTGGAEEQGELPRCAFPHSPPPDDRCCGERRPLTPLDPSA